MVSYTFRLMTLYRVSLLWIMGIFSNCQPRSIYFLVNFHLSVFSECLILPFFGDNSSYFAPYSESYKIKVLGDEILSCVDWLQVKKSCQHIYSRVALLDNTKKGNLQKNSPDVVSLYVMSVKLHLKVRSSF